MFFFRLARIIDEQTSEPMIHMPILGRLILHLAAAALHSVPMNTPSRPLPRRPSISSNNNRAIRAGSKRVVAMIRQHMERHELQIYDIASELRCSEGYVFSILAHRANFPIARTEAFADALRMVPGTPEREAFIEAATLSVLGEQGLAIVDRLKQ